jgi:primosomal protein N' (replication factor Y) (superfamily II helicase)
MHYISIAADTSFNNSILTYLNETPMEAGTIVHVPLGKRIINGCVLPEKIETPDFDTSKLKHIQKEDETQSTIPEKELQFLKWMANYYHYPLGKLIFETRPNKENKRNINIPFYFGEDKPLDFSLNEIQQSITDKIKVNEGFQKYLIHGVTGSGKSAIYLKKIIENYRNNKSALFLLPEINLTPQFIQFFKAHTKYKILVYNSSLTKSKKKKIWDVLDQEKGPFLIIGVRSSIFLPLKDLGIIVIDEEHDSSFKQDDRCPYNARDVAIKKAHLFDIPIILGSATPSLETYKNFIHTENYFELKERAQIGRLPEIKFVDLREKNKKNKHWPFHQTSFDHIQEALDKNEQILIFINRLGYSSCIQCRSCGHHFECPNCTNNLTFFKKRNELSCNICAFKMPPPDVCPKCSNMSLLEVGQGTEKIEQILKDQFSNYKVDRFDRDEIKTATQLEKKLEEFHSGKIDILVGTQMLAKGHNFKKVNLVLILGIDAQLNFPDFRANEKVYQLLTQVSGRAGRFGQSSKVLIHTLNPEQDVFKYVKENSFNGLYEDELPLRESLDMSPFTKLAMFYITSKNLKNLISSSNQMAKNLMFLCEKHFQNTQILGPRPALIEKRVNKYTWCILIKSSKANELHNLIKTVEKNFNFHHSISLKIDIDPLKIE